TVSVAPLVSGALVGAYQTIAGVKSDAALEIVVDVPAPPVIRGPLITTTTAVAGIGLAGATVDVFVNDISAGTTLVDPLGQWTAALGAPLNEGDRVNARQSVGGVVSLPSATEIVVTPPPPPTVGAPLFAGDRTVTGSGVPGAALEVFADSHSLGTTSVK